MAASERRRGKKHSTKLGLERKLAHVPPEAGELALVVQRAQVVEQLESAHQRLGRRRVHEVEVHEVVDAELL